tara:strand:+ start:108 stop:500 length:393 start_codon:yes stop_codon:yes gene_type:complete
MYDMTMFELTLNDFYIEFLGFVLTLLVGLAVKDWAVGFVKGATFRLTSSFKEGDKVILDGDTALIIKVGFAQTVFGVYNDDGYTWRYISNQKIDTLKLEKIVDSELHADTAEEKAQKLRSFLKDDDNEVK